MSRQLRIEFPGALLHITSRGNERRDIFLDDADRRLFLELLGEAVDRFKWILTAYVLMTNHFHLLVELTAETLSRGIQWLNGTYVQTFNKRHDRVGHLIQGRPKAPLIEMETYFLNVLKYIVLNPVRAGMVRSAVEYEWSSYRATAGVTAPQSWLAVNEVLRLFGETEDVAQARYARFVLDSPQQRCPWDDLVGQLYLGSDEWVSRMRERVETRICDSEHPLRQRLPREWRIDQVLSSVGAAAGTPALRIRHGRGGEARMVSAWLAVEECLLTHSEVAAGLRLRSSGRVTALVRECEEALACDPDLRALVDQSRAALYGL